MKPQAMMIYPTIFVKEATGGYAVYSPNIPGMHTEGDTFTEAVHWTIDAIATMLDGAANYPDPQDPSDWQLHDNEQIVMISVDMGRWLFEKARERETKTVRRTITVPKYLNDFAKKHDINVSRLATQALEAELREG
ncbi:type II toxin-antitoxin system HicB family antitoxin [Lacticaseibacillus pabuli]|uniref:Type II toxin-antitoxin system HicB family antitoxin n=1 Tax=Lacticaseibacillus pabuli TaxID=3025672 RepID=A0ABY7WR89_9LACO|nr:type II toxin-antitoxin system HicB family antitoxin [Lacticaseibacillus sp. KACC 23028]WDF82695.1 type II toxin-antitoxin system HicB family antitoxin [Lacticaseibacillus sp. KACC 23028]